MLKRNSLNYVSKIIWNKDSVCYSVATVLIPSCLFSLKKGTTLNVFPAQKEKINLCQLLAMTTQNSRVSLGRALSPHSKRTTQHCKSVISSKSASTEETENKLFQIILNLVGQVWLSWPMFIAIIDSKNRVSNKRVQVVSPQ